MPPFIARPALIQAAAVVGLTLLAPVALTAPAVAEAAGLPSPRWTSAPQAETATQDDDTALMLARDRQVRAEAAVDSLKRALSPARLLDPMPDLDRTFGLDILRADYADMQRRAAGYRATLGDQHPTLVAAEQVLASLRGQLLDGTRKALAVNTRDAADAKSAVAAIERRIAARSLSAATRAGDITGSITPPVPSPEARTATRVRPADPMALPPETGRPAAAGAARPSATAVPSSGLERLTQLLLGVALAGLAMLVAAWALLRSVRSRGTQVPVPPQRIEPGLKRDNAEAATPSTVAADPAGPETVPNGSMPDQSIRDEPEPVAAVHPVPVLTSIPLVSDVAAAFAPGADGMPPQSALARVSAGIHTALRSAAGAEGRLTVLLSRAEGLPARDADAAAVSIALAAAITGRRTLLMEARPDGRFRRDLVSNDETPALVEVVGTARSLYRLAAAGTALAVLPSDPGEAEVAAGAALRPDTVRLQGLSAFDTVVMVGEGADLEMLARGADVALVLAASGATAAALAAAAEPARAAGRPCAALLIEPIATGPEAMHDPGMPDLDDLRGSLEPLRRAVG